MAVLAETIEIGRSKMLELKNANEDKFGSD